MRKLTTTLAAGALVAASSVAGAQTPQPAPPPAAAAAAAATAPAPRQPLTAVPDEILGREFKDLDGQSLFLSDFRGQVLVLNVWASWCGPCRLEIPELNKLHAEFAPRGVAFVAMNIENPETEEGKVLAFAAEFQMPYPVVWLDGETALTILDGRRSVPQTLVVGPDGRIHKRFVGFSSKSSPAGMREAIRRALGEIE